MHTRIPEQTLSLKKKQEHHLTVRLSEKEFKTQNKLNVFKQEQIHSFLTAVDTRSNTILS